MSFSPSYSIVGTGEHKIELTDGHNKTEKKGDKGNETITIGRDARLRFGMRQPCGE